MKLGFMADSHDNLFMIKKAVEVFNEKGVELVLHLGDFVAPFFLIGFKDLKANCIGVFGNNDGDRLFLQKCFKDRGFDIFNSPHTLTVDNYKILMMHEPFALDSLARTGDYRIIAYAHTHTAKMKMVEKTLVLNPGECGGWLYGKSTVACVDIDSLRWEIIDLENV